MNLKLSELQCWILAETLKSGQLPKVRIMTDYFGLPTRLVRSGYRTDFIPVVDRRNVEPRRYEDAACSMNRSLKRLIARGLIDKKYQHYASVIILTDAGVASAKALTSD
jgi:hypothetical protein